MSTLKNDRYLRALFRQPVDRTPVWMMRQAGRHLPEYRALRQKAGDFMSLCRDPELACEATMQPLRRYELDAAILFSDILTIPDAMGLGLYFETGEGPRFKKSLTDKTDIQNLPIPDPDRSLSYVMDGVRAAVNALANSVPLIGFAGSPWTIATYMIEGGSSKSFLAIKKMLYTQPQLLHLLLEKLTESIILYLNAQIKAGINAVMIFDTWGGILSENAYKTFSLTYLQKIVSGVMKEYKGERIPITLFTKGGASWLESIAETGCEGVGLDWSIDIGRARQRIGHNVALQGNMDPAVLYAAPEHIKQEVSRILASYGKGNGHVFNLGHGIHPDISPEHVATFIDAVKELSADYHR